MRIHLISISWNEEKLLSYFLKHYSFCDLITLYDDGSTDKTHEIAESFPNVEIISKPQRYGKSELDEIEGLKIYNNAYKTDRTYDWIITTCIDEFLYHPNLLEKLKEYKQQGITIPRTTGFDMYSKIFPTEDKPLYELVTLGRYAPNHSKCSIFNPKIDINYGIGLHTCNPSGDVKYSDGPEFKILHFVYLEHKYMTERRRAYYANLSKENLEHGWGAHNKLYSEMTEIEYNGLEKSMVKVL
jgi:glycosyltransferase involved in cell wall biosynthesis